MEDRIFRLEEMTEAMQQSIDNLEKVIDQQKLLKEVLVSSDKAKDFKEYLEDLDKAQDNLEAQLETLQANLLTLSDCIFIAKNNEAAKRAVNLLIEGVRMFE